MDQIEFPIDAEWRRRREWFEARFDVEEKGGGYIVGEHAIALVVDLQAIFCVGAYISAIIVACTIVDAHLREVESPPDFEGGIKAAFSFSSYQTDLEWLRQRRNSLVHFKGHDIPVLSIDDQWTKRSQHEADAKRAIEIVANVLFENPWV